MSALVEFLHARFADDEAEAEHHYDPVQHRAHVEAKRRIVDEVQAIEFRDEATALAVEHALLWLVVPYAGHPDYRQEWRP